MTTALNHAEPKERAASVDSEHSDDSIASAVEHACAQIPPLWTLRNFVAVNPFLGLSHEPFGKAVAEIDRIKHGDSLLPLEAYREFFGQGRIQEMDLDEAISAAPAALGRNDLADLDPQVIRKGMFGAGRIQDRVLTYGELLDRIDGSDWNSMFVEEISKWCAGRFDRGQSSWPLPHAHRSIYSAWREIAQIDRNPEIRGLEGFREFVRSLPEDPDACIAKITRSLEIPSSELPDVLARSLATVSGWAGHLQYRIRQSSMKGETSEDRLSELLAIRLAFDGALHQLRATKPGHESWAAARNLLVSSRRNLGSQDIVPGNFSDLEIRHLWQLAFEAGFRRKLIERVTSPRPAASSKQPERLLQAAFCIDVRSEVLRRHLEERSERIQTLGFAGFFGLAIDASRAHENARQARCPALLSPAYVVESREDHDAENLRDRDRRSLYHSVVKQLRLSSVVTFPFVETVGQFFGLRLITDSLRWTRPGADSRLFDEPKTGAFNPLIASEGSGPGAHGIALENRIELAEGILRNMGLTRDFASYVLFCGHGSTTTNNPYGSALDCGACGGYSGDVNARAAASLFEDPDVRAALIERGLEIPQTTRFLAGLHDTTSDEVQLFDTEGVPAEDLDSIRKWFADAAVATRQERAAKLGPDARRNADRAVRRRTRDWSELRPEWGLAGNAGFIAAPRGRTAGVDLEGRCFLHDYHADRDPEGQVLELILTAPLVVASWINLQYYASTVDNKTFGSGSKTIHNVVGRHGVLSGNGGDLKVGLPFQSVHDGEHYVHEPMRLNALVEAPNDRIAMILERNPGLCELVENQWINLMSIDPEGGGIFRWSPDGFERIGDDER